MSFRTRLLSAADDLGIGDDTLTRRKGCMGQTKRKPITTIEDGPMPNVMVAQPNIGGAVCGSSVIPFLVPRHSLADGHCSVPCSNAANIGERKTWTQSEFCSWQNSVRQKSPPKCIHTVPAQETAKHPAKFC